MLLLWQTSYLLLSILSQKDNNSQLWVFWVGLICFFQERGGVDDGWLYFHYMTGERDTWCLIFRVQLNGTKMMAAGNTQGGHSCKLNVTKMQMRHHRGKKKVLWWQKGNYLSLYWDAKSMAFQPWYLGSCVRLSTNLCLAVKPSFISVKAGGKPNDGSCVNISAIRSCLALVWTIWARLCKQLCT